MIQEVNPLAEMPMKKGILVHVARLQTACTDLKPDSGQVAQRIALGISGLRGLLFEHVNRRHIAALTQAICDHCSSKALEPTVIGDEIDPAFTFIPVDWESRIGIDPSSYAMQRLIRFKDFCDIACDTDHDRHGIVTRNVGMLPAHHYLCVVADELFRNRSQWSRNSARGKNVFSSVLIDRALRPDHCKSKGPCERAWRRTPTNVRLALDGVAAVIAQTGRLAT